MTVSVERRIINERGNPVRVSVSGGDTVRIEIEGPHSISTNDLTRDEAGALMDMLMQFFDRSLAVPNAVMETIERMDKISQNAVKLRDDAEPDARERWNIQNAIGESYRRCADMLRAALGDKP